MLYKLFQQEKLPNYFYDLSMPRIIESGYANIHMYIHNYQIISLIKIDAKIVNKLLTSRFQQH